MDSRASAGQGLLYRTSRGDGWKFDVCFRLSGEPRENEVAYQEDLARRLDQGARLAILWIEGLCVETLPLQISGRGEPAGRLLNRRPAQLQRQ